jgi:hypothetical protein
MVILGLKHHQNTSFTESFPVVEPSSHEEATLFESAPLLLTYPDSSTEPSPEPETMEQEEIQPPEFPFEFVDDLFEDFGNPSSYFYQKRPQFQLVRPNRLIRLSLKIWLGT